MRWMVGAKTKACMLLPSLAPKNGELPWLPLPCTVCSVDALHYEGEDAADALTVAAPATAVGCIAAAAPYDAAAPPAVAAAPNVVAPPVAAAAVAERLGEEAAVSAASPAAVPPLPLPLPLPASPPSPSPFRLPHQNLPQQPLLPLQCSVLRLAGAGPSLMHPVSAAAPQW